MARRTRRQSQAKEAEIAVPAILTAKDAALAFAPVSLVEITLSDASVLRVTAHRPVNAAALAYGGNTYEPRLINSDLSGIAAQSENGADVPSTLTLKLADADATLMRNYEMPKGFRGAKVKATLVFWDAITNEFSPDSREVFTGTVMFPPVVSDTTLTITAQNRLNMSQVYLPPAPVQQSCPLLFPSNATERALATADDLLKWCPYDPASKGNYASGSTPYDFCDYTKAACEERGMYSRDSANRQTGAFAGIQWAPQGTGTFRDYRTGQRFEATASGSEARYGDYIPLLYGTSWVDALVLDTVPDGNFTRWQVIVCWGPTATVHKVVVGSYDVPHTFDDTVMPHVAAGVSNATEASKAGWWKAINNGSRFGVANPEAGYGGQGDPLGGMTALNIVVPNAVAKGSTPRIRVLAQGGKVRTYDSPSAFTSQFSTTPDWHIVDMLRRGGWDTADLDIASFQVGAAISDEQIPYVDRYGSIVSHPRYRSGLVLRQRRSVADVLRACRAASKAILRPV